MYRIHEMELQPKYIARVINIKKATYTPLVFGTSCGMGPEAMVFSKRIAENIANKSLQRYCDVVSFIRRRLKFDPLKTCLISLRLFQGKKAAMVAAQQKNMCTDQRKHSQRHKQVMYQLQLISYTCTMYVLGRGLCVRLKCNNKLKLTMRSVRNFLLEDSTFQHLGKYLTFPRRALWAN